MVTNDYNSENSSYLKNNPTWHVAQSPWKATQILSMIQRNKLCPKSIVEIGCGAGEILNQLHGRMEDKTIEFEGYEISPDAFQLCKERSKERLNYFCDDLLEVNKTFDLLLMIDVFEHVQDYIGFIKKSKEKAHYKIYHIPLDIAVLSVLINKPMTERNTVGHLHYYMKDTALATLKDAGLEIIDWFYTKGSLETSNKNLNISGRCINFMRRILFSVNQDLAVKLFGGFSLIVLAK